MVADALPSHRWTCLLAITMCPANTSAKIDYVLNKVLVGASKVMSCYRKMCSKADRLLPAMSSMCSWSWASAFRSRAGIEASSFVHWDTIVASSLL